MRVHLAGRICQRDNFTGNELTIPQQVLIEEKARCSLVTYAYAVDVATWAPVWKAVPEHHVIIDSGAYTAHTQGMKLTTAGLASFARDFLAEHAYLASAHFMTLDVMGDQAATWRNFEDLTERGVPTLPVLTGGCTVADIERAAQHPYIALGDLGGGKERRQARLDYLYHHLMRLRRETGVLPKTHMLGVTEAWALRRYPAFSCDSSSWLGVVRFGGSRLPGTKGKVPSYAKSAAATAGVKEQLRAELRHFDGLSREAERLWQRRGITFTTDTGAPA